MNFPVKMYSDFDGVLNIDKSSREDLSRVTVSTNGSDYFNSETTIVFDHVIINKLVNLVYNARLDFRFLSTWCDKGLITHAAYGLNFPFTVHHPAFLNPYAENKKEWTTWKADAIIRDQEHDPKPFIWVDDRAPEYWSDYISENVTVPHLIIQTDSFMGLTEEDLLLIDNFSRSC